LECKEEMAVVENDSARSRIIGATFDVLMEKGYAGASTREIARRAKVSKRELYALFESKDGILAAMIEGRAARMRAPLALPDVADRDALCETLRQFGVSLLREGSRPEVMSLFRLAIAGAERAPDLARRLDAHGRQPTRAALVELLSVARERGLLAGDPLAMASQFFGLLWAELQIGLLLRLVEPPARAEIEHRARSAAVALLALNPAK
jgi:AcrR family transcriptional regulator